MPAAAAGFGDETVSLVPAGAGDAQTLRYAVVAGGQRVGTLGLQDHGGGVAELWWELDEGARGQGLATRAVGHLIDHAFAELGIERVEARVNPSQRASVMVGLRNGMRKEGVVRGPHAQADDTGHLLLARLSDDPGARTPEGFRAMLNSSLPRKRGIAQLLVRDPDERVLLCRLTYKKDWDLPGGVVEVGESPHLAAGREALEELSLDLPPGELLLTDWLPPWGGWDDALCLVFDGGVHEPSLLEGARYQAREIRDAAFCTPEEVRERAADFTARRVEAALARARGEGVPYTESGRPV